MTMIRYMKTIVSAVLIVTAIFFVMLVIAQVFTGYDFSAAYDALGRFSAIELGITGVIELYKKKQEYKKRKDENNHE